MQATLEVKHQVWELPPVILHPFAETGSPEVLLESSRARLMLDGLIPRGDMDDEELERRLLAGRFSELRMLYYVGKDLDRWVEQCVEMAQRDEEMRLARVGTGSFIRLLVEETPQHVKDKLASWGVADYRSIFRRALGLRAIFRDVPHITDLTPHFIRGYYRYADHMFACRLQCEDDRPLDHERFNFEIYASAEYSQMLERQWEVS